MRLRWIVVAAALGAAPPAPAVAGDRHGIVFVKGRIDARYSVSVRSGECIETPCTSDVRFTYRDDMPGPTFGPLVDDLRRRSVRLRYRPEVRSSVLERWRPPWPYAPCEVEATRTADAYVTINRRRSGHWLIPTGLIPHHLIGCDHAPASNWLQREGLLPGTRLTASQLRRGQTTVRINRTIPIRPPLGAERGRSARGTMTVDYTFKLRRFRCRREC